MLCRAANSRYECERAAKRRLGLDNGIVPAKRARAHILKLSKRGVGRRSICAASGLPRSTISAIRKGSKANIRKETERRILAVTGKDAIGGALIDARPTWKLIYKLLDEGFTKGLIAKKLGYSTRALQLNMHVITAGNAAKVRRLYEQMLVDKARYERKNKGRNEVLCDDCGLIMAKDDKGYHCLCGARRSHKVRRAWAA